MSADEHKRLVSKQRKDGRVQGYWMGKKPKHSSGGRGSEDTGVSLMEGLNQMLSHEDSFGGVEGEGGDTWMSLRSRAGALGVDLSRFESVESDADDVAWSTNEWSFKRSGIIEASDVVVVRDGGRGPEVLCIRRSHPPFASTWALPGGLRDEGESFQVAADRELGEETGIRAESLGGRRWLGEIQATDWDPRSVGAHVGAAAYHTTADVDAVAGDDAVDAEWIPVEDIASGKEVLAFGHAHWVAEAFAGDERFAERLDVVSEASRYRNRRIIERVNEVRRAHPEVEEIPASVGGGSWGDEKR